MIFYGGQNAFQNILKKHNNILKQLKIYLYIYIIIQVMTYLKIYIKQKAFNTKYTLEQGYVFYFN